LLAAGESRGASISDAIAAAAAATRSAPWSRAVDRPVVLAGTLASQWLIIQGRLFGNALLPLAAVSGAPR
jgi:hypothetical protein